MIDYNLLGQCIDTTFGRSSTTDDATKSVKVKLAGNGDDTLVTFVFSTIVNTFSVHDLREVEERCKIESEALVKDAVTKIKKEYKDLGGGNLRFKQITDTDGLELISGTFNSSRRMSYYRRHVVFSME